MEGKNCSIKLACVKSGSYILHSNISCIKLSFNQQTFYLTFLNVEVSFREKSLLWS